MCIRDSVNGEWGEFGADAFYDNLGVDLLKQSELYNTDNTVKFFTDKAIEITETFSDVKLAFNGMLCLGNLAAGTNNTYNRYQEMKVVADISDEMCIRDRDEIGLELDNTIRVDTDYTFYNELTIKTLKKWIARVIGYVVDW